MVGAADGQAANTAPMEAVCSWLWLATSGGGCCERKGVGDGCVRGSSRFVGVAALWGSLVVRVGLVRAVLLHLAFELAMAMHMGMV